MIASSRIAKALAAASAVALHGAALWTFGYTPGVEIEGSAGAAQASLGNSFADLAAGTISPSEVDDRLEPVETGTVAKPGEAETTGADTPDAVTEADRPERQMAEMPPTETGRDRAESLHRAEASDRDTAPDAPARVTAAVTAGQEAEATEPEALERSRPKKLWQAETAPDLQPVVPPDMPAVPQRSEAARPGVAQAVPAEAAETVASTETAETIEADADTPTAVTTSPRPRQRPKAIAQAQERIAAQRQRTRQEKETQRQRAAKSPPQGNAARTAHTGTATGAETVRQQANTGTGQSREAGNAAASNYPGQVMRKISRVPRPRVGARGTAVVAFTIASGGGLAGLSLARSSGNGRLDQAALTVIRRAAPFPPPPAGARRSFSIRIKGG